MVNVNDLSVFWPLKVTKPGSDPEAATQSLRNSVSHQTKTGMVLLRGSPDSEC